MTLLEVLAKASRIAKSSNTMPILANVLLEPEGNGITVTATDLELRYQATVEGLTIPEALQKYHYRSAPVFLCLCFQHKNLYAYEGNNYIQNGKNQNVWPAIQIVYWKDTT